MIVSLKKYENKYIVFTSMEDDSVEPHLFDSEEEAFQRVRDILAEQEKQSNEN